MEQQNAVRGDDDTAIRRKSLGRLKDMSIIWDVDPQAAKYTRNDDTDQGCPSGRNAIEPQRSPVDGLVDVELPVKPPNMSAMEMESIKERERASMLRKCAQHLELESVNGKYTRENFKRGILNKVSLFYVLEYTHIYIYYVGTNYNLYKKKCIYSFIIHRVSARNSKYMIIAQGLKLKMTGLFLRSLEKNK